MKIAIALSGKTITTNIDENFGRCNSYCIYETDTEQIEIHENPFILTTSDAGTHLASILIDEKIDRVIALRFGAKVIDVFKRNNIQMIIPEKKIKAVDIINTLKNNKS